jgi:hypothetical protein
MPRRPRAVRATSALVALAALVAGSATTSPLRAQTIDPAFAGAYALRDLGGIAGIVGGYSGIAFLDANTLLVGAPAERQIFSVALTRDAHGRIATLGPASPFAAAGGVVGDVDGGLAFGPGGVLFYTTHAENGLGQIEPGSAVTNRFVDLDFLAGSDVVGRVGSLGFVPPGRPGAGNFRVLSYETGNLYRLDLTPDGGGTFDVAGGALFIASLGRGPRGMAWVPIGAPLFAQPSLVISDFDLGQLAAYDTDVNGDPILATRRAVVSGIAGGNAGVAVDPLSGDFLVTTFGLGAATPQILQVTRAVTAVPEPSTVALAATGLLALALARRRARR